MNKFLLIFIFTFFVSMPAHAYEIYKARRIFLEYNGQPGFVLDHLGAELEFRSTDWSTQEMRTYTGLLRTDYSGPGLSPALTSYSDTLFYLGMSNAGKLKAYADIGFDPIYLVTYMFNRISAPLMGPPVSNAYGSPCFATLAIKYDIRDLEFSLFQRWHAINNPPANDVISSFGFHIAYEF